MFANVRFLIKQLKVTIYPNHNIWDNIAIVKALNSFYNDFRITTTNILKYRDKTIEKIQQILASTKTKLVSKKVTKMTKDLVIASRKYSSKR